MSHNYIPRLSERELLQLISETLLDIKGYLKEGSPKVEPIEYKELQRLTAEIAEAKPMKDLKQVDLVDSLGAIPTFSAPHKSVGKKKKAKKKKVAKK